MLRLAPEVVSLHRSLLACGCWACDSVSGRPGHLRVRDVLLHWCAGGTAGARVDGRYDPHTPPLVPRAGSLRGGGADASNGTRLVSTSVFTPSMGHSYHEVLVRMAC